jgi:hypothetical protein
MKELFDSSTLVIAGAWNPAILTPVWVATEAMGRTKDNVDFPVKVQFPVAGLVSPIKYDFLGINYSAAPHAITFFLGNCDEGGIQLSLKTAAKIIDLLHHTPITGFGFNSLYEIENPHEDLLSTFSAAKEIPSFLDDADAEIVGQNWGASIKSQNMLINIGLKYEAEKVFIDFNVHFEINSPAEASELLSQTKTYANAKANVSKILGKLTHEGEALE